MVWPMLTGFAENRDKTFCVGWQGVHPAENL